MLAGAATITTKKNTNKDMHICDKLRLKKERHKQVLFEVSWAVLYERLKATQQKVKCAFCQTEEEKTTGSRTYITISTGQTIRKCVILTIFIRQRVQKCTFMTLPTRPSVHWCTFMTISTMQSESGSHL